ncbi:hypothetical protein AR0_02200 [Corynebacterium glutamicum]|nr:hypothetical protein AR0_02200 [Corynebacterium glutamicum]
MTGWWCSNGRQNGDATQLDHAGIPADWNLRPTGTHSWGWWQDDLRGSWDTFARSFGLENENA